MKKEIIAIKKKPSYIFIVYFIILFIFSVLWITIGIIGKNNKLAIIFSIVLTIEILLFVLVVVITYRNRKKDDTIIFYESDTFYFPKLKLKIKRNKITRVVYQLSRYVVLPIANANTPIYTTTKNNVGKLHLSYICNKEEYYLVLKNVINPDIVEERIKEICGL